MKVLLTTLSTLFAVLTSAQYSSSIFNVTGPYNGLLYNKINSGVGGKVYSYSDIQGTPYIHNDYKKAKIGDFADVVLARYNSYSDEVEIKLNEDVRYLLKENNYSPIKFIDSDEQLMYISDNEQTGYYYVLSVGNSMLLRKNSTMFIDEQPAQTSYSNTQPAKFQNLKPAYFIYKDSKLIPFKKENDLIQLYPNKNLKTLIKDHKIRLDKEKDLIKLLQLID